MDGYYVSGGLMACVVAAVGLAFFGSRGPRERTWAVMGLAFGLMSAFLVAGWSLLPDPLDAWEIPGQRAVQVDLPLMCLGAFALCAARFVKTKWAVSALRVSAVLGFIFATLFAASPAMIWGNAFGLSTDRTGTTVHQTTGFTCGPASVAAVLRHHGIPTSEYDAAKLCWTLPLFGTSMEAMAAGFRAEGLQATYVYDADWEDLVSAPKPCLAETILESGIGHVMVVRSASAASVEVMDPLVGEATLPRDIFEETWLNGLIVVRAP